MRLIDKDHMIYRLEQASKYFGGEQTDMFDERFSQGLKEASIKVAEEPEIKAIPLSTLQEIWQEIEKSRITKNINTTEKMWWNAAIENVLEIISKHIKEIEGSDTE